MFHRSHWFSLALVCCLLASGCNLTFEEDLSTEFSVTDPGNSTVPTKINKRFRFSRDPGDAESVTLRRAEISVVEPEGATLDFLERLEVFVVRGDEKVLVASTESFPAGASTITLTIDYSGDLRGFTEDQRVRLSFVAYTDSSFDAWPPDGFQLRARVILLVEIW